MLESLVGQSILPRGTGIVTRRPLIMQLIYCPKDDRVHRSSEEGNYTLILSTWVDQVVEATSIMNIFFF